MTGRVFLGPLLRLAVDVEGEQFLVDLLNTETAAPSLHDRVSLTFSPSDARPVGAQKKIPG